MKKTAIIAVAAAFAASFGLQSAAQAGQHASRKAEQRHTIESALAAGLIGAVAGTVIGSAIGGNMKVVQHHPVHQPRDWRAPDRRWSTYAPRRIHRTSAEPWSAKWFDYCRTAFRSFNPHTGTYRGHDGRNHFCVVPGRHHR